MPVVLASRDHPVRNYTPALQGLPKLRPTVAPVLPNEVTI